MIRYVLQVQWPDGSSRECLVPYASLLNHSPYPHIVQYGQLDSSSQELCFPLFRPVGKGQQCFLSYGPLPNLKLILFYGMALADNPHDVVPIQLQVGLPCQCDQVLQIYSLSPVVFLLVICS